MTGAGDDDGLMGTEPGRRERAAHFVRHVTRYLVAGTAGLVGVASLYVANVLPGRSSSAGSNRDDAGNPVTTPATASPTPSTSAFGQPSPAPVAPSPGAAVSPRPVTRTRGS
jgi:hypothetical protein